MSFAKINFFSKCLNMRTDVTVLLPEYPRQREELNDYKRKYPEDLKFSAAYLLNGFTGDYTDWFSMIPMEYYSSITRIACVIPSGLNSWYENIDGGLLMQKFIAEELPAYVEAVFPIMSDDEHRYIAGISMGGRGAAIISVKYAGRYNACACLSAPLSMEGLFSSPEDLEPDRKLIQNSLRACGIQRNANTDFYSAANRVLEMGKTLPDLFYAIGENDPLCEYEYDKIVAFIRQHSIKGTVKKIPGAKHDFDLWNPLAKEMMFWFYSKENNNG